MLRTGWSAYSLQASHSCSYKYSNNPSITGVPITFSYSCQLRLRFKGYTEFNSYNIEYMH